MVACLRSILRVSCFCAGSPARVTETAGKKKGKPQGGVRKVDARAGLRRTNGRSRTRSSLGRIEQKGGSILHMVSLNMAADGSCQSSVSKKVDAGFKDGILKVVLHKTKEAAAKKIAIKTE